MTKVTNLAEYGINEANVLGFLNKHGYTDVYSWLVYEKDGKTYCVRVERDEFVPKYDGYYCLNNMDQTKNPVRIPSFNKHVEVSLKKDYWGYMTEVYVGGVYPRTETTKIGEVLGDLKVVAWGDDSFRHVELTPKGKVKKTFYKLSNELSDDSYAFLDYNF